MKILESIKKVDALPPLGLTIGNFDGVHKGHRLIFQHLRSLVGEKGSMAVLTFSNHPSYILPHLSPIPLICSMQQKISYLEQLRIDFIFLIPFTFELASQTYDLFLKNLFQSYPFQYLVLGKGAALGKDKKGVAEKLQMFAKQMGFQVTYLEKEQLDGGEISSKKIRELISQGKFKDAAKLLDHPYALQGPLLLDTEDNKKGFLSLEGLCHPTQGTYPVEILLDYQAIKGEATFTQFSVEIQATKELSSKIVEIFF